MHVLLQYQSKSYYIIGQEVYYSIGRFYYIIGQLLQYRAFLLHYRAVITVSGVYYIIGWYSNDGITGEEDELTKFVQNLDTAATKFGMKIIFYHRRTTEENPIARA